MEPFRGLSHVFCKLSGMITEAHWDDWSADDLRPYVHRAVDIFGPGRVMYGSDWPVCLLSGSYWAVHGIVEDWFGATGKDRREHLFGDSCAAFYKVK